MQKVLKSEVRSQKFLLATCYLLLSLHPTPYTLIPIPYSLSPYYLVLFVPFPCLRRLL
jgi:hypothetical protein